MLRAILICPDAEVNGRLESVLSEIGIVTVIRVMDRYPNALELLRFLRAHAPQVVFLSTASMTKAGEVVREIEKNTPGVQIVAIGHSCDPQLLLELMRAGIREYAAYPFDRLRVPETLGLARWRLHAKPDVMERSD